MKLSNETVTILQNFQTINPSLVIHPGNVLRTMSPSETVYAKAKVPDTFPKEVGIYDLSKLLGILSLNKESNVEFDEKHLTISQGKSKIIYTYSSPALIVSPDQGKDVRMPKPDVTISLDYPVLQQVLKAMSILGFTEIAFRGKDGVLDIVALNTQNRSADVFSTELGETKKEFLCVIEAEKLKLLPGPYMVEITKEGLAHFAGQSIEYWIGISTKSEF